MFVSFLLSFIILTFDTNWIYGFPYLLRGPEVLRKRYVQSYVVPEMWSVDLTLLKSQPGSLTIFQPLEAIMSSSLLNNISESSAELRRKDYHSSHFSVMLVCRPDLTMNVTYTGLPNVPHESYDACYPTGSGPQPPSCSEELYSRSPAPPYEF